MGLKINEAIPFKVFFVDKFGTKITGEQVDVQYYDESNNLTTAITATERGNGWYDYSLTPDAAGCWGISFSVTSGGDTYRRGFTFWVEKGQEEDIEAKLDASDSGTTHAITVANDQTETQVFERQAAGIYELSCYFDLDVLETAGEGGTVTIRVYNKIDAANYSDIPTITIEYVVGAENEYPSFHLPLVHQYLKVTIQCNADVTAQRDIYYRYLYTDRGD